MGPKERRGTVLSPMEEAALVALRVQARLPLDDVFVTLKGVIPQLTRSSLHRCLQRHGISRLPKADREKPKKFEGYEIGYLPPCGRCLRPHIDITELRHEGGKGFLFIAVDRTSKLVFARIYRKATKLATASFPKVLIKAVPYPIHTIDKGGRYSPAECTGIKKVRVEGNPDIAHVSTSFVEAHNKTMRMHMRGFTRLTNGQGKKVAMPPPTRFPTTMKLPNRRV